ncbi:hypothetical protein EB796_015123 [Bugula neritina]|uniref:non-specific serine/threonine protein kinase n=1 Tax=Bugula neritina TaxID=10212 RepID=A0A7J7JLN5_BUGNE|nr:hypothetical protein EB796_015123 [Bugula neritina]
MANSFIRKLCIGTGSFGKVWLVTYTGNRKQYVLKEVKVNGLTDKEIDQAVTEVKVLSRLSHFNIIRYKQAWVEGLELNIVMEYAERGDLHQMIQLQASKGELFSEAQILSWFLQMTFAVKYIHKENILHRDLKTQNVFLTKDNILKIGDFGIAKVLSSDSGQAVTAIGTPYYLSPEICQSQSYNKKSDIWALGCILYEMATLKHAFQSSSFNGLLIKIIHGDYGSLPAHFCYQPISWLIEMMLQHNPEDRPTADDIMRLPVLRPHIAEYERLALRLIEGRQGSKLISPRLKRQSLDEFRGEETETSPALKRRTKSADSPVSHISERVQKKKPDLRKSVILRQAMIRDGSPLNSSTYRLSSPDVSPIASESTSDDLTSDSSLDVEDDVFHSEDSQPKPELLDVYCKALAKAKHTDSLSAAKDIQQSVIDQLGTRRFDQLMVMTHHCMNQMTGSSSHSQPLEELKTAFTENNVSEELSMLMMLQWFFTKL